MEWRKIGKDWHKLTLQMTPLRKTLRKTLKDLGHMTQVFLAAVAMRYQGLRRAVLPQAGALVREAGRRNAAKRKITLRPVTQLPVRRRTA
jgi:hypothetical protein